MKTTEIEKGIFITKTEEKDINFAIQKELEKEEFEKKELMEFISNPNNEYKPSGDEIPF